MKVKIIEIHAWNIHSDDYNDNIYTVKDTVDWDEITEEEFQVLKQWAYDQNNQYKSTVKYSIICESNVKIPSILKAYVDRAKRVLAEKEEREKKKILAEQKRKKTLEKRKTEKEKKLLESLKEKYESDEDAKNLAKYWN